MAKLRPKLYGHRRRIFLTAKSTTIFFYFFAYIRGDFHHELTVKNKIHGIKKSISLYDEKVFLI